MYDDAVVSGNNGGGENADDNGKDGKYDDDDKGDNGNNDNEDDGYVKSKYLQFKFVRISTIFCISRFN